MKPFYRFVVCCAMASQTFKAVLKAAADRKGGMRRLNAMLPGPPATAAKLRRLKDDLVLSTLSKGVFRAGFNWKVVENRWPDIEAAVEGFDPEHLAPYGGEDIERYLAAPGVIKNRGRLQACIENARWLLDLRGEHGSFGKMIAKWPSSDIVGLWQKMQAEGSRVGGSTGPYFLRELGKDTWLPTNSVLAALVTWGVLERPTKGKRNLADAQAALNAWHEETGRSYADLSRILAYSVPN
jgi:3-methyladenine DNA glycosylase Tag